MPTRFEFGGASPPFPDLYSSSSVSVSISPQSGEKIGRNHNHRLLIGLAVGGSVTAAIAFIIVLLLLLRRLTGNKSRNTSPLEKEDSSVNLRQFSYRELKAATKSFDDAQKLGQGGFGVVYRGQLGHGGQEIAVKVLDSTSLQGEREFHNEVSVIGKVSTSPHIVGLLGFCSDTKTGRRLLVYEYMQNRSLQDALFDNTYPVQLSWGDRFKIMMDTAKALAFLHTDCDPPIIHGDIKPSNILLDGSFSARIADFGLARFKTDADVVAEDLDVQGQARSDGGHRKRREQLKEKQPIKEESVITVEDDTKLNTTDVSVNVQSPETFATSSVTEENPVFLSSNSASPEGLQYETDTVTENLDERTPSEMVDLEKNNGASMAEGSKGKNPSADCKSMDFSRDEEDKTSLSEGCFDKASIDSGRPGGRKKKDWWWRQDSMSGEFSVKDYVMDWIGTEIKKERPKSTWGTAEERDSNLGSSRRTEKKKPRRKDSLDWWTTLDEKEKKEKSKGSSRQGREWWREEYCEELSKKKSKNIREWWEQDTEENKFSFAKCRSKSTGRTRDWLSRDWLREEHSHHAGDWGSGVSVSSTPSTRGTLCYVAPEYGGGGMLSEKSDVYSFAVVMLVIISGRRPLQVMGSPVMELERANLISWAKHVARSGANMLDLVDAALGGDFDREQALLCITVALLCLQRLPGARPSMSEVVKILSGESEPPPLPVEFSPSPPYGVPFRSRRKLSRAASAHRHLPP